MKLFIIIAVIFAVCSAQMIDFYDPQKAQGRGYCFSNHIGPMNAGERREVPGKCMMASCNQEDRTVRYTVCQEMPAPSNGNCRVTQNLRLPFPQCCPTNECWGAPMPAPGGSWGGAPMPGGSWY